MTNPLNSLHHDGSRRYVFAAHGGEMRLGDEVTLRLRSALDAPVERLFLRTCPDGEQSFVEMFPEDPQPETTRSVCRWWRATLRRVQ